MTELILRYVGPFVAVMALVFLAMRLGFFSRQSTGGRIPFLTGCFILLIVLIWQTITQVPGYHDWFVIGSYSAFEVLHIILAVGGALLVVVGLSLYADFWQMRADDIEYREQRSSLLGDLQVAAREPYQVLQLLDIALKEILSQVTDCAGATFLVNRRRRQLVFTGGFGLSKSETAACEHLDYDRNQIIQTIDLAEPLIFGKFETTDAAGKKVATKFESHVVLPMVSGSEPVGALVLFSTETQRFGRSDVSVLAPVAGWLAEKIRSARLVRQNASLEDRLAQHGQSRSDLLKRLDGISKALDDNDPVDVFCQSLVGLLGAQEVFVVGLSRGTLEFCGGSSPEPQMSEPYRTALLEAVDRDKPLVINQEATADDGRVYVCLSTLVYPLGSDAHQGALLLRKETSAFDVQEDLLKLIATFARLAEAVVKQSASARLDLTRRKGLRKILGLLHFDRELPEDLQPDYLIELLNDILPMSAITIGFIRQANGNLRAEFGKGLGRAALGDFDLMPGEGFVGQAAQLGETQTYYDRKQIDRELQRLEVGNREAFYRALGERGTPVFMLATPISDADQTTDVVVVLMSELSETDRAEWERLLTLATGLFSFRRTIAGLYRNLAPLQAGSDSPVLGVVVNRLNNYLSGIVGNAELAQSRGDVSGDIRAHLGSIIAQAEQAGQYLRTAIAETVDPPADSDEVVDTDLGVDVNHLLRTALSSAEVTDGVYMVAGHTVEINLKLRSGATVTGGSESLSELFLGALGQFAALADDQEIVTVSTYRLDDYVYLDVSRHSKNLPPLERLADIVNYVAGQHESTAEASFLGRTLIGPGEVSLDRASPTPTYLSLKFPAVSIPPQDELVGTSTTKVLVVDDQKVILDLVTAMCLSQGYIVKTVTDPKEGIILAAAERFDVVLVDLAMPGMSGLELARKIHDYQPEVPIILLTGWEVGVDQDRLRRAGVSQVLHKPFRIEQLATVLDQAVSTKSLN